MFLDCCLTTFNVHSVQAIEYEIEIKNYFLLKINVNGAHVFIHDKSEVQTLRVF